MKNFLVLTIGLLVLPFLFTSCDEEVLPTDPNPPVPVSEHSFYVSPTGDDTQVGSIDKPWKTIQKAAESLEPGDTVFIRAGVYHEIVIPKNSGTVNKHITYTSYAGETAIVDGSSFADTYLQYYDRGIIDLKTKHYIDVIGLQVQNSAAAGITSRYGSSHINVLRNKVLNCKAPGIAMGYSRENHPLATHIIAAENHVENCAQVSREAISFRSVDTFEIANNIVKNTPKEAIDAKSGSMNGKIYGNTVSNVGAVGIYIDAGYPDQLYTSSKNIKIYSNTLKNCRTSIAIASENQNLGEDIWVFNNLAYDTSPKPGDGIVIANYGESGPLKNLFIINNTIVGKGHRGIYINNLNVDKIYIRNNICSQNTIAQIDVKSTQISGVELQNNLIDGLTVDTGTSPVIAPPKFVQLSSENLHLSSSSPTIDKGTAENAPSVDFEGTARPSGVGYDIGAYEYKN